MASNAHDGDEISYLPRLSVIFVQGSVVQPCRHSPHVATRDLNVATDNCSKMDF